jgi:hypothetical protein
MPTVWLADWEMECCGEPFAVGDYVQWPGKVVDRSDWLERLFSDTRVVVHYAYDGHHEDGEPLVTVSGMVQRIDAVASSVVRIPVHARGDEHRIVEGGAVRHSVQRVERTPPFREKAGAEFVGYLVHLG